MMIKKEGLASKIFILSTSIFAAATLNNYFGFNEENKKVDNNAPSPAKTIIVRITKEASPVPVKPVPVKNVTNKPKPSDTKSSAS